MLSARDARRDTGRRPAFPSLRQLYDEYVLQRIEGYKNSISREELMRLAGEATAVLHNGPDDQFVLTEVLMADVVDAVIIKRLRIKSFRRWKEQFARLRTAQREPTHWGLDRTSPVVSLLGRLEPGDRALVIGGRAEACAYLLAAHDLELRFWDDDLGIVDKVEQRMGEESLAARFFACCVPLDRWIPSDGSPYDVLVLDVSALAMVEPHRRPGVLVQLQELTAHGGVHVLLPAPDLVPEAIYSSYAGWVREKSTSSRRAAATGTVLVKPVPQEVRRVEPA